MKIGYKIIEFFNNLDDMTSDFIDKVEVEPIQINTDLYVTGFRRVAFSYTAVDVHLKTIKKVKVGDEWMLMEPENDMWIPCSILDDESMQRVFDQFVKNFGALTSFHIMHLKYKVKGKDMRRMESYVYTSKRTACKDALAARKVYEDVSQSFEVFMSDGKGNFSEGREPSDFEVAAAAMSE